MMGLGNTTRGETLLEAYSLAAEAQEEQPSSRECRQTMEGSWQPEDDPVSYFGKQDQERRFKLVPLVRGHQKGAKV